MFFSVFRCLWAVGVVRGRWAIPYRCFSPCRKQPADGAPGVVCAFAGTFSGREAALAVIAAKRTYRLDARHVGKASVSGRLVVMVQTV